MLDQAWKQNLKPHSSRLQRSFLQEGYLSDELHRCLELHGKYLLLVRWTTLEAHTVTFRQSLEYQEWKQLLHHFYDPFPVVEHFEEVISTALSEESAVRK